MYENIRNNGPTSIICIRVNFYYNGNILITYILKIENEKKLDFVLFLDFK